MTIDNAMWTPSLADIQWMKDLLRALRHGGQWIAPIMGLFVIDHKTRVLTLVSRSLGYDHETYLRVATVCAMLGYKVQERKQPQ